VLIGPDLEDPNQDSALTQKISSRY